MDGDAVRQFRSQMSLLHRRLRREQSPIAGQSWSSLHVLGAIARRPGISPHEVGEELRMASSNVAAALRELLDAGLLSRAKDPDDGRRVRLTPTAAGDGVIARIRTERDSWFGQAVEAVLSADEAALLTRAGDLMQRLAEFDAARVPSPAHASA